MIGRAALVAALIATLTPTAAHAAVTGPQQVVPSINGEILATATLPGGLLAIGGAFTEVSGKPAHHLAVINPGSGAVVWPGNVSGFVRAFTFLDGRLYVGHDGGAFAVNITGWTRSAWQPGTTSRVTALTRAAGRVYVATGNSIRSTDPTSGARHWTATTAGGDVRALLAANGHLYAGGLFESLTDPAGGRTTQHGLVALNWATGRIDPTFRTSLRRDGPLGYEGQGPLSLAYDDDPTNPRVIAGIASLGPNSITGFDANTGVIEGVNKILTGDGQTVQVLRFAGKLRYLAGYHRAKDHFNELTHYYAQMVIPDANVIDETWQDHLSGAFPGNETGSNGGATSSALIGGRLFLAGDFTERYPALVSYSLN